MIVLYILVALIGGVIGFGVAIILAAAGRFDDADAMAITMDAHRDRAEMLNELSREMNQ